MQRAVIVACIALAPWVPNVLVAQDPSDPMSATEIAEETSRLAFKVGTWDVTAKVRLSPTTVVTGTGTLQIRWGGSDSLLADMNIAFDNFTVVGRTTRHFNPARRRWDVGWYPSDGSPAEPHIDGVFTDGRFIEINYGVDRHGPFIGRLVIYDISHDHFSVRKDRLYDDGAVLPEIWTYEATRIDG